MLPKELIHRFDDLFLTPDLYRNEDVRLHLLQLPHVLLGGNTL